LPKLAEQGRVRQQRTAFGQFAVKHGEATRRRVGDRRAAGDRLLKMFIAARRRASGRRRRPSSAASSGSGAVGGPRLEPLAGNGEAPPGQSTTCHPGLRQPVGVAVVTRLEGWYEELPRRTGLRGRPPATKTILKVAHPGVSAIPP
jgi:hypothetical protein